MHSSTKATLKLGLAGLFCAVIAAIPGTAFYLLWSWAVAQVPAAFAYAWAVKLGITLVMVLIGGVYGRPHDLLRSRGSCAGGRHP